MAELWNEAYLRDIRTLNYDEFKYHFRSTSIEKREETFLRFALKWAGDDASVPTLKDARISFDQTTRGFLRRGPTINDAWRYISEDLGRKSKVGNNETINDILYKISKAFAIFELERPSPTATAPTLQTTFIPANSPQPPYRRKFTPAIDSNLTLEINALATDSLSIIRDLKTDFIRVADQKYVEKFENINGLISGMGATSYNRLKDISDHIFDNIKADTDIRPTLDESTIRNKLNTLSKTDDQSMYILARDIYESMGDAIWKRKQTEWKQYVSMAAQRETLIKIIIIQLERINEFMKRVTPIADQLSAPPIIQPPKKPGFFSGWFGGRGGRRTVKRRVGARATRSHSRRTRSRKPSSGGRAGTRRRR
jgi:hypothetical protein